MKKIILFLCILASFTLLYAQNHHVAIETTTRPTPGHDWKFEFVNMDTTSLLIKVVNTAQKYFDMQLNAYRPVDLLPPTKISGTSLNGGLHYGHLRSTLNLANHSSTALVILYKDNDDLWESVYEFDEQKINVPTTFIWHGGELEVEIKRNLFRSLQPSFHILREIENWDHPVIQ